MSVCQIGAFGFNPLRLDNTQRDTLARAIPLAAATGCPYIVINGGNYHASAFGSAEPRNFTEDALDEVAAVLKPLLALAEEHGVHLSIEAILKSAISSPERFLSLWSRVESDALVVNIDVTSLYDYWDLIDPSASIDHICASLAGHYGLVHIKEVALAEGFHIHAGLVPLGEGRTDWARVLAAVAPHLPADSWVVLEHVQSAEEAKRSLTLLRRAATEAGVSLK
ncbi:MAG: TIM barrel protein [Caldilineaceae bacterium]|nr:TIM barrel protein [Caldilineaceae bacterium]